MATKRGTKMKKCVVPEKEEETNGEEYRIVKDNQLWEKQDKSREETRTWVWKKSHKQTGQ